MQISGPSDQVYKSGAKSVSRPLPEVQKRAASIPTEPETPGTHAVNISLGKKTYTESQVALADLISPEALDDLIKLAEDTLQDVERAEESYKRMTGEQTQAEPSSVRPPRPPRPPRPTPSQKPEATHPLPPRPITAPRGFPKSGPPVPSRKNRPDLPERTEGYPKITATNSKTLLPINSNMNAVFRNVFVPLKKGSQNS